MIVRAPGEGAGLPSRQCALCDHACAEDGWICWCCTAISPASPSALFPGTPVDVMCAGTGRIHGPLLPPALPAHVLAGVFIRFGDEVEAAAAARASADPADPTKGTPP